MPTTPQLLAVALGGAAGSVLRYVIGVAATRGGSPSFPIATLAINVTGSLLLGFLFRYFTDPSTPAALRAALTIGFCGGYTTFSTFSLETLALAEGGHQSRAALYVTLSVVLSVAAAWLGTTLARTLRA
jgi:CrcB protein